MNTGSPRERKERLRRATTLIRWEQPTTDAEAAPLTDAQVALIRNTILSAYADIRRESRR